MEQKQLKQFTFYELYADILNGLNDVDAGKFAKRICEYEFENTEPTDTMTDKEVFYWSNKYLGYVSGSKGNRNAGLDTKER